MPSSNAFPAAALSAAIVDLTHLAISPPVIIDGGAQAFYPTISDPIPSCRYYTWLDALLSGQGTESSVAKHKYSYPG